MMIIGCDLGAGCDLSTRCSQQVNKTTPLPVLWPLHQSKVSFAVKPSSSGIRR